MKRFEFFLTQECANDALRFTLVSVARSNLLPVLLYEITSWILKKILVHKLIHFMH